MALLLEVDPVGLVRGRSGTAGEGGALEQYVNDRPYVASSFLSVAISRLFGTALSGRSKERPELVERALPFEVRLPVLPCRGGDLCESSLSRSGTGLKLSPSNSTRPSGPGARVEQALLVRGTREFESVEAWQVFVHDVLRKANAARGSRIAEEVAAMRRSPWPDSRSSPRRRRA